MAGSNEADNGSKSSPEGLSEKAYEIAKRRQAAAIELVTMLEDQYESAFRSHAGTLLRAAAWLTGTSLYRSLGLANDVPPGSPVLSEGSDQEGLKLMKVFMFLVDKDGIKLRPDDYAVEIPSDDEPRMQILEVQQRFQVSYNQIMERHEFDYLEGAKTGAVACARLVKLHCLYRRDLEPAVAASTVSIGFVEGSKTAPARLEGNSQ